MQKYFYATALSLFLFTSTQIGNAATPQTPDAIMSQLKQQSQTFAEMPRVAVPKTPFLFVTPAEIAAARQRAETTPWAKTLKTQYLRTADLWVKKDYNDIKEIIPPWGSIYVYGLGKDLDPVQHKKMQWRGWADPRHVEAADGTIYPNAIHPDDGSGWTDPATGQKYFFVALANGKTTLQLTWHDIPDLANAYALTGNEDYAQRALWLLDAIATIYPRAYEGPIDYPGNEPGRVDGGRLDAPYYQSARAMTRFAYSYELLKFSVHANEPSPSNPGYSMLDNIEINLLMNGADYCLRMAKGGEGASHELNNGNIDYNRAPLLVGALLGIPQWVDWALNGPLGFRYALTNTIDINGRYYESSPSYAKHTRSLLLSTAEALQRMKLPQYPKGYDAYNDKRFALFALNYFTAIQSAGHLPMFEDGGPDRAILTKDDWFDSDTLLAAEQFYEYSNDADICQQALKAAALMKTTDAPTPTLKDEWELFHAPNWDTEISQTTVDPQTVPGLTGNTLLFDYGTSILRQGEGFQQRAALLHFGPTLNHGQADEMGLLFYAKGREFSFDPGYYNTHLRFGFTSSTVAHNILVVNRHNQLREPSPGGDLQSLVNGSVISSMQINDPDAYRDQNMQLYKRRVALINLSPDDSYLIDTFWARGGHEYDYSLHGIMQGKLNVLPSSKVLLTQQRAGSVLSPNVDYADDLDDNGRVKSFSNAPFYFAPPGDGFGFLSHPTFYSTDGQIDLQWSATDKTNHQMYVTQFPPSGTELITAHSPKPRAAMDLTYAFNHIETTPDKTVRFTSVILPTVGENKVASVTQLQPKDNDESTFGLHIKKVFSTDGDDYYFAANSAAQLHQFDDGIAFQGEEGFARLDQNNNVQSASLAGIGQLQLSNFTMSVRPLLQKPMTVLEVANSPLRLRVDAPLEITQHLTGALIRLNRKNMARPFVLLVKNVSTAPDGSWLTLDASSNVEAIGTVQSFDAETNTITTDAPFPRTRPYLYAYDFKTGESGSANAQESYNESYDGLCLVNPQTGNSVFIKTVQDSRTKVLLQDSSKSTFKAGDQFEIQVFAAGDQLEVPVWGQAILQSDGTWKTVGTAIVTITK